MDLSKQTLRNHWNKLEELKHRSQSNKETIRWQMIERRIKGEPASLAGERQQENNSFIQLGES
jgi:hypothetical protein